MNKLRPFLLQQIASHEILLVDARKMKMDRYREILSGTRNQNQDHRLQLQKLRFFKNK
jgi:hypothetical protein